MLTTPLPFPSLPFPPLSSCLNRVLQVLLGAGVSAPASPSLRADRNSGFLMQALVGDYCAQSEAHGLPSTACLGPPRPSKHKHKHTAATATQPPQAKRAAAHAQAQAQAPPGPRGSGGYGAQEATAGSAGAEAGEEACAAAAGGEAREDGDGYDVGGLDGLGDSDGDNTWLFMVKAHCDCERDTADAVLSHVARFDPTVRLLGLVPL